MADEEITFAQIKTLVGKFSSDRDWEQFHAPKNLAMAIAAEAGELLEPYLWIAPDASRGLTSDPLKREQVSDELADIIVLCAQFANITGIDISEAVRSKIQKNEAKYPVAKAKGRSAKYDELK